jgi:hypothetical protein
MAKLAKWPGKRHSGHLKATVEREMNGFRVGLVDARSNLPG